MAKKPAKPCQVKGCPGVVREGICSVCNTDENKLRRKRENQNRPTPAELGYDYQWSKVRTIYINAHIFCEECERQGRVTLAVDVDHKIPIRAGGTNEDANLQSLCRKCHNRKTRNDAKG